MTTTYRTPIARMTIDEAIERMAAATGSYERAMAATGASYNGHRIEVFRNVRGWAVAYRWGGTNWILHGQPSLAKAIAVALAHPFGKAPGGYVQVTGVATETDAETCREAGLRSEAEAEAEDAVWRDGRFRAVTRGGTGAPALALKLGPAAVAALRKLPAGLSAATVHAALNEVASHARRR